LKENQGKFVRKRRLRYAEHERELAGYPRCLREVRRALLQWC